MKKPLSCLRCQGLCIEVGHAISYPKRHLNRRLRGREGVGHEYRYACPDCGAEYIQDTLSRQTHQVPRGADFHIRIAQGEEIVRVNSPQMLRFWGLPAERKGLELTDKEVRKLQRRARRIRRSLSTDLLDDDIFVWEQFKLTPEEIEKLLGRTP
jgi:hypothetical protein